MADGGDNSRHKASRQYTTSELNDEVGNLKEHINGLEIAQIDIKTVLSTLSEKLETVTEKIDNQDVENSIRSMNESIEATNGKLDNMDNIIEKMIVSKLADDIREKISNEVKEKLKLDNYDLREQINLLYISAREATDIKATLKTEIDDIKQKFMSEVDNMKNGYKKELDSTMAQKLKKFNSDILTKEKILKERNFLDHRQQKSMRDSVASKEAEWNLFYHLCQLIGTARQHGMNQRRLRIELCKSIAFIDGVLSGRTQGYQLKLSRKRAIFQIFYEIATDTNIRNASMYKYQLIKMLTPRDHHLPSQHILDHIGQPYFINSIMNKLDVRPIQLTPRQATKFNKIIEEYQESLTNTGKEPTFHLGSLVDKDTDVFTVIAFIQAVLGVSRMNQHEWYDPETKILYASPLNPYVLCI